jgi:hypothetical protein
MRFPRHEPWASQWTDSIVVQYCHTAAVPSNAAWNRCREDDCSAGKPWILELGCRRSTGSGRCYCRKWHVVHQTVRDGILGGLGHSDSRVEFGSCVFGHLECGMAKSGKRGHRTGWGHPKSHIRFCHRNLVSSIIDHGTCLGTRNRSGVLRL